MKVVYVITFCILASCTSNHFMDKQVATHDTATATSDSSTPLKTDTAFQLDFFATMPDRIGGCGEYLTYDTSAFEKTKYIFLSNLTEYAVIRVKGKDIYLNKDTTASRVVNDKSYTAVYKGEGYTAVLTMQQTKAYDEGGFYTGTLEIVGDKVRALYKIHGEAGC